ncbi:MAG: hypothetical protein II916_03035 [Oscillospiraceae bacterium]|nr:hypothetical protein [Oscillospiraceae bacterium]
MLYNDGYYEEALEPWFKVLQYDGNYRRAFLGISAAYLVQENYEGSMKYAKLADSPYRYNRAFEGYRQEWLAAHYKLVTAVVILLVIAGFALAWWRKKYYKRSAEYDITHAGPVREEE